MAWHEPRATWDACFVHVSEPCVELNPDDAARLKVKDGDLVELRSRQGMFTRQPRRTTPLPNNKPGPCTGGRIPDNWTRCQGQAITGVNGLTSPRFCLTAKQPELNTRRFTSLGPHCRGDWLPVAWLPQDQALQMRKPSNPLMAAFRSAACVPFGHEPAKTAEVFLDACCGSANLSPLKRTNLKPS